MNTKNSRNRKSRKRTDSPTNKKAAHQRSKSGNQRTSESRDQGSGKPKRRKLVTLKKNRQPKSLKEAPVVDNPIKEELAKKGIRLNKYLSNSGICARRKADELIKKGVVSVNEAVVTEMGFRVQKGDVVKYNGKVVAPEPKVYVLLNKPKDTITTTYDPKGRRTVMDLTREASKARLYPIGRLDRQTTGLLMLTNDGELSQLLSHPSKKVRKIYHVILDKPLTKNHFETIIKKGVVLEEGTALVDELAYVIEGDRRELGIELHIGWNRVVRRIFEHFGYEVKKLDRIVYGPLTKKDLPRGRWRYLDKKEIVFLKHFKI